MSEKDAEGTADCQSSHSNRSISRRSFLATAAGAVGAAVVGRRAAAAPGEYETITVPANTHRDIPVGDGETFENKLIDISAEGATFRIDASGSDWVIRNVGVKGVWDVHSDGHEQGISAAVDDGGTGVIDTYYFADGCPDDTYPGVTGIYVRSSHAGRLRINNVNIQDMPNNAIYGSTPGYSDGNEKGLPGGGRGVLEITNSYAADCKASHFRMGTNESFVKNCVAVGGDRGVWAKFNDTRVIDSDFSGHATNRSDGDIVCGTNTWNAGSDAKLTVENTAFEHSVPGDQPINNPGTIVGDAADRSPRTDPPEGVPLSAEEAATGTSEGAQADADAGVATARSIEIRTVSDTGWQRYSLTTSGPIRQTDSVEDHDEIVENDDGTWTVNGIVGNGGVDDFEFAGEIVAWRTDLGRDEYTLTLDGQTVDPEGLPGDGSSGKPSDDASTTDSKSTAQTFEISAAADTGWRHYSLTTTGEIASGRTADSGDEIVENDDGTWTVNGIVGNGGVDDFEFAGEIVAWGTELDGGQYAITIDGEAQDPASLPADDEYDESATHTIQIDVVEDTGWRHYSLTTGGEIHPGRTADSGDEIVENDDGTWTVNGIVGNGGVDDFEFTGAVREWSTDLDPNQYTLTLDDEAVSLDDLCDC